MCSKAWEGFMSGRFGWTHFCRRWGQLYAGWYCELGLRVSFFFFVYYCFYGVESILVSYILLYAYAIVTYTHLNTQLYRTGVPTRVTQACTVVLVPSMVGFRIKSTRIIQMETIQLLHPLDLLTTPCFGMIKMAHLTPANGMLQEITVEGMVIVILMLILPPIWRALLVAVAR